MHRAAGGPRAGERLAWARRPPARPGSAASALAASSFAGSERGLLDLVATSVLPARPRRCEHLVDPLVAEDRDAEDVVARGQPGEEPVDCLRACGRRPRPRRRAARAARQLDLDVGLDGSLEERLGGLPRASVHDAAASGGTSCSNVLSDMTTTLAACATASFSFAICSGVSPSTSVCSSATFVSRTTGASTTFVASSRPPEARLDDGHVHSGLGELGQRGGGQHLELGRSERLRGTANPRDGPLEGRRITIQPLVPARDVRRRVGACPQALGPQQRSDRPGRGRLAVRPDHVDRREGALRIAERREERAACGRARTPRATGSSEATHSVAARRPSRGGHRAHDGSARASRAPPRPPPAAPST